MGLTNTNILKPVPKLIFESMKKCNYSKSAESFSRIFYS